MLPTTTAPHSAPTPLTPPCSPAPVAATHRENCTQKIFRFIRYLTHRPQRAPSTAIPHTAVSAPAHVSSAQQSVRETQVASVSVNSARSTAAVSAPTFAVATSAPPTTATRRTIDELRATIATANNAPLSAENEVLAGARAPVSGAEQPVRGTQVASTSVNPVHSTAAASAPTLPVATPSSPTTATRSPIDELRTTIAAANNALLSVESDVLHTNSEPYQQIVPNSLKRSIDNALQLVEKASTLAIQLSDSQDTTPSMVTFFDQAIATPVQAKFAELHMSYTPETAQILYTTIAAAVQEAVANDVQNHPLVKQWSSTTAITKTIDIHLPVTPLRNIVLEYSGDVPLSVPLFAKVYTYFYYWTNIGTGTYSVKTSNGTLFLKIFTYKRQVKYADLVKMVRAELPDLPQGIKLTAGPELPDTHLYDLNFSNLHLAIPPHTAQTR